MNTSTSEAITAKPPPLRTQPDVRKPLPWRAAFFVLLGVFACVEIVRSIPQPTAPPAPTPKAQLQKIREFQPRRQVQESEVVEFLGEPDKISKREKPKREPRGLRELVELDKIPTEFVTTYYYGPFGGAVDGGRHFTFYRWYLDFENGRLQGSEKKAPLGQDW